MKDIIKDKSRKFKSKPYYINAVKYEKGMEDGWIVEFTIENTDDWEAFETEKAALDWIASRPKFPLDYGRGLIEAVCEKPKPYFSSGDACANIIEDDNSWIIWGVDREGNIDINIWDEKSFFNTYENM